MKRKTVFLSYAWKDDKELDVEFFCQTLGDLNIDVKQDKYTFIAGRSLWGQICKAIENPEINGYIFFTTAAWLESTACAEELDLAFSHCLASRGSDFPIIAVLPKELDSRHLPLPLQSRVFVKTSDPEWARIIRSALDGKPLRRPESRLLDYDWRWHDLPNGYRYLELWPRLAEWSHIGVMQPEADVANDENRSFHIYSGPAGGFLPGSLASTTSYDYWNIGDERWRRCIYTGPFNSMSRAYIHFPRSQGRSIFGPITQSGVRRVDITN